MKTMGCVCAKLDVLEIAAMYAKVRDMMNYIIFIYI